MHVNKANRGRQGRQKKAREKERDGGKTSKPDGSGVRWVRGRGGRVRRSLGAEAEAGGSFEGGAAPDTEEGEEAGEGRAWRWRVRGRESRGEPRRGCRWGCDGEGPRLGEGDGRKLEGEGCKEPGGMQAQEARARTAERGEGRDREVSEAK